MRNRCKLICCLFVIFFAQASVTAEPARELVASQPRQASNSELEKIVQADQAIRDRFIREGFSQALAQEMWKGDRDRRARVKELLSNGQVRTCEDFYRSALVLQHGGGADDYLMAHTLAIASASQGHAKARWLAAATLDRYLQAIGQS